MKRTIAILLAVCILWPCLAGAGQDGRYQIPGRLIVVTLDTVRSDHLGYMGYPRKTTPFLDSLADESIVFRNAFSSVSMTIPEHASIFTGLYPFEHGVLNQMTALPRDIPTLADYMRRRGFITAAFVSMARLELVDQGFDVMDAGKKQASSPPGLTRRGDETIDSAIKWLDKLGSDDKFMLWIHLFDAHTPYRPEITYKPAEGDPARKEMMNVWIDREGVDPDIFGGGADTVAALMDKYDGGLQFMDTQLKRLYDYMSAKGFNAGSLWVITEDHGQGLGSHDYFEHYKRIFNEQVHTPIIFHTPDKKTGMKIDRTVEHIDILPTLAEWFGFPLWRPVSGRSVLSLATSLATRSHIVSGDRAFSMTAKSLFSPVSGFPALPDPASPDALLKKTVSGAAGSAHRQEPGTPGLPHALNPAIPLKKEDGGEGVPQLVSFQDGRFKCIVNLDTVLTGARDSVQLFDMSTDALEKKDLAQAAAYAPEKAECMEGMMSVFAKAVIRHNQVSRPIEVSGSAVQRALEEQLRSLGY